MKTLYFDCFSGISGDMTIGALIDAGVDFDYLKAEIGKLPVDGFELRAGRTVRANISAVKFDVVIESDSGPGHSDAHGPGHSNAHGHDHAGRHAHVHRKASEIIAMIRGSALEPAVRRRATAIFEKLAVSEGRVHDLPPEDVEFHEVGAIDSIVDVVGAAIGLEAIGVDRFACSAINVGGGFIHCQHGVYPVPAPATANLLVDASVYSRHVEKELVTPTGAAILAATVDRFGPLDGMTIETIGYGAGTSDFGEFPNCLRLFVGDSRPVDAPSADDRVTVIEANIDDMSAEALAYTAERLLAEGALDVVTVPAVMKKGRAGHLVQVLARPGDETRLSGLMFEETTTIGVRMREAARRALDREIVDVEAAETTVRVKVSSLDGRVVRVSPEYDDCARAARETGRPFDQVRDEAVRNYRKAIEERKSDG